MSLVDFLMFALSSAGITVILVLSAILEPFRAFVGRHSERLFGLISCTMCTGFWVGVCSSFYFNMNPIIAGAVSSIVSWTLSTFVDSLSMVSMYIDSIIEDGENDERHVE